MYIACSQGYLEIVKVLLVCPKIDISSSIDVANENGIDLEKLKIECEMVMLETTVVHSSKPLKTRAEDSYNNFTVFIPLLKLLAPQLTKVILRNENFNSEEHECLQDCINILIYGMAVDEFKKKWTMNDNNSLLTLFVLNEAQGDLVSIKQACIETIKNKIQNCNGKELGELFETMIHYKSKIQSQFEGTIIGQLSEYCLGVIFQNGLDITHSIDWISRDEMRGYVVAILSKTIQVKPLNIHEECNSIPSHPLVELLKDTNSCDVELMIGNCMVKCHKIILASNSVYFDTLFSSGHFNMENDKYGEEMIYLVHHCYGVFDQIPPHLQIPLLTLSRSHEMNDLENKITQQVKITDQSFMPLVMSIGENEDHGTLVDQLVKFVVENKQIITEENYDNIPHVILKRIVLSLVKK